MHIVDIIILDFSAKTASKNIHFWIFGRFFRVFGVAKYAKNEVSGNNSAKNGQILLKFLPNIICIISRSLSHFDPFWANWGPWGGQKVVKNGQK